MEQESRTAEKRKEELENDYRAFLRHIKTPAIDRVFDQKVFDWFYDLILNSHERVEALEEKVSDLEILLEAAKRGIEQRESKSNVESGR